MAGYASRQATYSDGDTILATHSNSEFNQILAGFNASTGHKHDGTAGEGATIDILIDNDSDTKITVENSADEDIIRFFTGAGGQQLNIADGKIEPQVDNDVDLGSASKYFKNLYIKGTATLAGTILTGTLDLDGLKLILDADADTSITADTDDQIDFELSGADDFRMTANTFTALSGSTISVPSGAFLTLAGTGTVTGTLDVSGGTLTLANDQISGDKVHGGTISGSVTIVSPTITTSPTAAGATWPDLGTVTTADINGGTIDGTTIGGSTPGAVTTSSLVATTADINGGTVDGTIIGGSSAAAGTFTNLTATGTVTPATASDAYKSVLLGSSGQLVYGGPFGAKRNLLINGGMVVNQRAATLAGAGATSIYLMDNLSINAPSAARFTFDHVTSGGGTNLASPYAQFTITTAETAIASGDLTAIEKKLEGQDVRQLAWGTANAMPIVFSADIYIDPDAASGITFPCNVAFFVQSYSGSAYRSYTFLVPVAAADTWERISKIIPGDTSGSPSTGNALGFTCGISLVAGTTYESTAETWAAGQDFSVSGATNLAGTTGNVIRLTNMMVTPGNVLPAFEFQSYHAELRRCVRTFERIQPSSTSGVFPCSGATYATTLGAGILRFEIKRANAAISFTAANTFNWVEGDGTTQNPSVIGASEISDRAAQVNATLSGAATGGGYLARDSTDTSYIDISAEI